MIVTYNNKITYNNINRQAPCLILHFSAVVYGNRHTIYYFTGEGEVVMYFLIIFPTNEAF